ncbi:MAG TPA: MFS transporter, partial [Rectinemataceae bacterium]|nr:MFS transporter [Rectinemataceae bacterium]
VEPFVKRVGLERAAWLSAATVVLGLASLATAFVSNAAQLIAVRAAMGLAAAMTTPGSAALAFRLFEEDRLRVRAITLISTVGLVGLAIGPTLGGLVLAVAPWQVLLMANAPIAAFALIGLRSGIAADRAADLHQVPVDFVGAALATATVVLGLMAPTLFVNKGAAGWLAWADAVLAMSAAILFVIRERGAAHPLLDLGLLAHPLVTGGLAFKAAASLAVAGLGYMVTLQLQLDWGWKPAHAAIGMLPQVLVLVAGGAFVEPFVKRVGLERAAWLSAATVVLGLAVFALCGRLGYAWVAAALVLVAAGMRVVGVVAATNVLRGLPKSRTTIGAALADTATELSSGIGIAVTGTILASMFTGEIAAGHWSARQTAEFREAVRAAGLCLTAAAAALVAWGITRSRRAA